MSVGDRGGAEGIRFRFYLIAVVLDHRHDLGDDLAGFTLFPHIHVDFQTKFKKLGGFLKVIDKLIGQFQGGEGLLVDLLLERVGLLLPVSPPEIDPSSSDAVGDQGADKRNSFAVALLGVGSDDDPILTIGIFLDKIGNLPDHLG